MKRIVMVLIIGLFLGSPVFADQVDEGLPGSDDALKAQTRAMIQAGINAEDAIGMTRAMIQQQFTHQQMVRARQMVMTAAKNGLPVAPIASKAREGAAKQVRADDILAAMERVGERYAKAYAHANQLGLKGQTRTQAGSRMAEGMAAGLNQTDCDRIAEQIQQRSRTMSRAQAEDLAIETLSAARDLARRGVSSKNSADLVCQALKNNYQAKQMQQLRQQFTARARQQDPQGLALQYTYSFQHGQDPAGEWGGGAQGPGNSGGNGSSGGGNSDGGGSGGGAGGGSGGGSGSGGSGGGNGR